MTARTAKPAATADQLLSTEEVAKRLGCSVPHVHRLHDAGELPAVDLGLPGERVRRPKLRFAESAVAALIAARTHPGGRRPA